MADFRSPGDNPGRAVASPFAADLERADALLFGRVTYEMMEAAWRQTATGTWPDWMADWMIPFAQMINSAKKYVVSSTLDHVDWNAELIQGDLGKAVPTQAGAWQRPVRRTRDPPAVVGGSGID